MSKESSKILQLLGHTQINYLIVIMVFIEVLRLDDRCEVVDEVLSNIVGPASAIGEESGRRNESLMIHDDGELLRIASSIGVSLLHLHDCNLWSCIEIGTNDCTKSSIDMWLSISKQNILELLHHMIISQVSKGWRSGGLQTDGTYRSKWVEHLRTESNFRHGGDLTRNSKSHSRKDNTSIIGENNLLNRQWDKPHELGKSL